MAEQAHEAAAIVLLLLLLALVAVVILSVLRLRVARPLRALEVASRRMAAGDHKAVAAEWAVAARTGKD